VSLRFSISKVEIATYVAVCAAAVGLLFVSEQEKKLALKTATSYYKELNGKRVEDVTEKIENNFRLMLQGLRTIARLPAVRAIDRHGLNFTRDARISAQEIYNNLAQNVAVSEVYIISAEFDPHAVDPSTGQPQQPIATFDNLIVGRHADQKSIESGGRGNPASRQSFT